MKTTHIAAALFVTLAANPSIASDCGRWVACEKQEAPDAADIRSYVYGNTPAPSTPAPDRDTPRDQPWNVPAQPAPRMIDLGQSAPVDDPAEDPVEERGEITEGDQVAVDEPTPEEIYGNEMAGIRSDMADLTPEEQEEARTYLEEINRDRALEQSGTDIFDAGTATDLDRMNNVPVLDLRN